MSRALAALAVASVALAVPAAADARPARPAVVRDCHRWASYPNLLISSARGMGCRAAQRDLRAYRGQIRRRFRTPGGFGCMRVSGGRLGGQWRCTSGTRAYRFEFGD